MPHLLPILNKIFFSQKVVRADIFNGLFGSFERSRQQFGENGG